MYQGRQTPHFFAVFILNLGELGNLIITPNRKNTNALTLFALAHKDQI
jgi:hypothetical protein